MLCRTDFGSLNGNCDSLEVVNKSVLGLIKWSSILRLVVFFADPSHSILYVVL